MSDEKKRDDISLVGYKSPPKDKQFKPGKSGNPSGRPLGAKNLATIIRDVVYEQVTINEHGQRRKITKLEASIIQLVNKAASGDHKSIQEVINLCKALDQSESENREQKALFEEHDEIVLKTLAGRLRRSIKKNDE